MQIPLCEKGMQLGLLIGQVWTLGLVFGPGMDFKFWPINIWARLELSGRKPEAQLGPAHPTQVVLVV